MTPENEPAWWEPSEHLIDQTDLRLVVIEGMAGGLYAMFLRGDAEPLPAIKWGILLLGFVVLPAIYIAGRARARTKPRLRRAYLAINGGIAAVVGLIVLKVMAGS